MELYRSHVLVCGNRVSFIETADLIEHFNRDLKKYGIEKK